MTAAHSPGGGERPRPRVLLVDDDPSVLAGLRRQLRTEFDILTATSAASGLELVVSDGPFDVVVSDMRMPVMDGAAFLSRVRSIARDTTRVLLTGQADVDTAIAAVNEGQVFRFLSKPCPAPDVRQCLREAAEQHDRSRAEQELIDRSLAAPPQAGQETDPEAVAELESAYRAGQLQVWYQPVVDLATGQITSAEALVRWQHPQRGLLAPGQFIPAAERSGLIIPIGRWVLRQACHDAARWPRDLPVAVNLQPDQLRDPRLIENVRSALSADGLPAARLTLEVTESVLLRDARAAAETLARLRDMGIAIAIDDFGTGYSSLSYLQNLPVSILKIDQAFIASLPEATPVVLVRTIVQLAAALGLKTVAEGIETDTQLRICTELGCQHGQGFLFAKAMPSARLVRVLAGGGTALTSRGAVQTQLVIQNEYG